MAATGVFLEDIRNEKRIITIDLFGDEFGLGFPPRQVEDHVPAAASEWHRSLETGNTSPTGGPLVTDVRADPYEQASAQSASYKYDLWHSNRGFLS